MEENMEIGKPTPLRIIVTGPESTGKTELVKGLVRNFGGEYIPEYAREYIEDLGRAYTFSDVLRIAEQQVKEYKLGQKSEAEFIFIDTYLIITKLWFSKVFGEVPVWLEEEISRTKSDLYLLCKPDIPWVADEVRENGGEMREVLFNDYKNELVSLGVQYEIISGIGNSRLQMAINKVNLYIHNK